MKFLLHYRYLPLLTIRSNVEFMRETCPWLRMQVPITISNRVRIDLRVRGIKLPFLRPWDIDHAINDSVNDMYTLWSELPSQRLREGAHSELAGREGGERITAAHCGCGGGEDQCWRVLG